MSLVALLINVLTLASPIFATVLTLVEQLGMELIDLITNPSTYKFGYYIKLSYSLFTALPLLIPAVFQIIPTLGYAAMINQYAHYI